MQTDIEVALSAYSLPSDTLWEMRRVLEKRVRVRFSEGLSPEGKLAMKQAMEEFSKTGQTDGQTCTPSKKSAKTKNKDKSKRNISFSDSYKKSASARMDGDITDKTSSDVTQKKKAIGGGKVETAMETVEVITHDVIEDQQGERVTTGDGGPSNDQDIMAIEETAKRNSVEKCLVWMEVNDNTESPAPPGSNRSQTVSHTG